MAGKKKGKAEKSRAAGRPSAGSTPEMSLPIKYLVISGRDEMKVSRSVRGQLEDLSMTGLIFQTTSVHVDEIHISYDETPVIRNRLTMEIDLPGKRKVTAMGEVAWYERSLVSSDKIYHVGVTFMDMSPEDRETLRGYLVTVKKEKRAIALDV